MQQTLSIAAASAVFAGGAFGAVMTVDQLLISAPHTVVTQSAVGRISLDGDVGPIAGVATTSIDIRLEFSFVQDTIAGDRLVSGVSLLPWLDSGVLEVTNFHLSADLYDGADLVAEVESGAIQASLATGHISLLLALTDTFEAEGAMAFVPIGDHGEGALDLSLQWTGFGEGDELLIDIGAGPHAADVRYVNFVPSPAGGALGLAALALIRRRR